MSEGWTPQSLTEAVNRGEIYPLYFLYGDETYLIDDALANLESVILGDGLRDFNLNSFYGSEADPAQVRDAVETLPMMAQVRVVIIKEAHELGEKDWEALSPLLDNPVPTTALICVGQKIDKRKKYIKRFIDAGCVVEFKRPYDNQIPDWVKSIAKKHGLQLSGGAVELMQQLVGSNLSDIDAEMKKIAQYLSISPKASDKQKVSEDDVMKVVSHVKLDSVFELTDAIGTRDRARALTCLANLLDNGQNEVGILALVSRHVRILKLVNEGVREGLSGQRLSARAGVSPYFLKSYVGQARTWNDRKIEDTFQALLDTDRALKSSSVAPHIWLENFIVQTCS
ncbi:MAG TPA: DNA polymerase III subunit delta [Bdellovibrionales bacterium]|nr:DNA polymerase III subunit delta [Bdellovibrionales bacterium]